MALTSFLNLSIELTLHLGDMLLQFRMVWFG
jgi:hypothetical protein